ncbi:TIR domain-containing protein [Porphyromonas levii]|uniref:TIR domain-containing protein n=1 Tax=Porphyromonas levii TaxID=28114 RepID=UPI00036F695D|nr:TIR domain-containing protein [Porphyromonas levii]
MAKRQVFYSFHYENDVFRVQQIRNIGALEDNKPVSANEWESVKRGGEASIKKWIDDNLRYKSCVVVLVGEETANRKWVRYEIEKAWELGKGLVGVYIHNLKDPRTGKSSKGKNPFDQFEFDDGTKLSSVVKCYNPNPNDTYNEIKDNLEDWIEEAIASR